jgi:hypothetical protein
MVQQWSIPDKATISDMRAERLPPVGSHTSAFKPQTLAYLPRVPDAEPMSVFIFFLS